jgi:hypothetical protein
VKDKPKPRHPKNITVKLPRPGMTFEEVVQHVLKAGPMPKATKPRKTKSPRKPRRVARS